MTYFSRYQQPFPGFYFDDTCNIHHRPFPARWSLPALAVPASNLAAARAAHNRAVRRYETRRRNGNSGKGKPRSKADQKKAEELAAARAAVIAAGLATEADFAPPPKRVAKKDVPTVKRRPGRPKKVLTEEERAAKALREATGPRPVGRPRKLTVKPPPRRRGRPRKPTVTSLPPPSPAASSSSSLLSSSPPTGSSPEEKCHVTASLAGIVSAWMAGAAAQAAAAAAAEAGDGGLRGGVASVELKARVKSLAVSKTKEVTGTTPGEAWTPRMTRIALAGIEAWDSKWEEVFPGAAGDGSGDGDGDGDAAGGGSGLAKEGQGEERGRDDAPGVSSTPKAPRNDLAARERWEGEEGVTAAKAAPAAATTRLGLPAGKAAGEGGGGGGGGGGVGDASPLSDVPAPSAGVASGDGEERPAPARVARELAVDVSASKLSR